jgi:hypothetical protein
MQVDSIVALLRDAPEHRLRKGQVGAIKTVSDDISEAEFRKGREYYVCKIPNEHLLLVFYSDTHALPEEDSTE